MDAGKSPVGPKNRLSGHNGGAASYDDDRSVNEIKSDIDRTRGEIDQTLDALGERLNPRHLLDDVLDMFRSSKEGGGTDYAATASKVGRKMLCQIKEHPVPSMLIGAGLAWLLFEEDETDAQRRRILENSREPRMHSGSYVDARTGEPYDETYGQEWRDETEAQGPGWGEKARHAGAKARGAASSAAHGISSAASSATSGLSSAAHGLSSAASGVAGAASSAASRVGEWAGSAREGASQFGSSAGHYGRQMGHGTSEMSRRAGRQMQRGYAYSRDRFEDALEEYPLAVGVGFLALGVIAGLALPRTRQEDEWMGEASDELKQEAWHRVEEAQHHGAEALQATVEAARGEAEKQGLTGGTIVEKVKHVVSEAADAASRTAKEEGIDPKSLKEKGEAVASKTAEHGKQEAKHHTEEMQK